MAASGGPKALAKQKPGDVAWRGDEHQLQVSAAKEAGLATSEVELELYTDGFKAGMIVEDPYDGAIVARGRTVLGRDELLKSLKPTLRFLSVHRDAVGVEVHDGEFELRIARSAADASSPALDAGWVALQVWLGAAMLGLAAYTMAPMAAAAIIWGVGLVVGGLQLRKGMASGRAMLSARLAMALGMLAQEQKLILPPSK